VHLQPELICAIPWLIVKRALDVFPLSLTTTKMRNIGVHGSDQPFLRLVLLKMLAMFWIPHANLPIIKRISPRKNRFACMQSLFRCTVKMDKGKAIV
jgi:hypothetical protein